MTIYGAINHSDRATHLCRLEIAGTGPDLDNLLPSDGWRPLQGPPGVQQATHPSPIAGITVILDGCLVLSVDAGPLRQAVATAGDMLILLDTLPPGHATEVPGPNWLRAIGIKLPKNDWSPVRDAFTGWPDGMLSP